MAMLQHHINCRNYYHYYSFVSTSPRDQLEVRVPLAFLQSFHWYVCDNLEIFIAPLYFTKVLLLYGTNITYNLGSHTLQKAHLFV